MEDRLVPDGTSPIVYDVRNAFGNLQIADPWQVSVQDPSGNSVSQGNYNTAIDGNQSLNGYMTAPDPETITMTPSYVIRATGNGYSIEYLDMPAGMKSQVSVFGMSQTDQNPSMIYHSQDIPQGSGTLQVALPWLNGSPRVYQIRLFDSINGIASARIIATNFYQNRIENPNYVRGMTMDDARYSMSKPLSDVTTLMGVNVDTNPHTAYSMAWKPNTAVVHPGPEKDAVLSWKSPGSGTVDLNATLKDAQLNLGDGVTVTLEKKSANGTRVLASGMVTANGTLDLTRGSILSRVSKDDLITLKVSAKGSNASALNSAGDATETSWTLSYTPGPELSPEEILLRETAQDIADSLLATGQKIGDLRTAVADGNRTEQWELDAWRAYVERVRTNGPVSPLELQAAEAGEAAQETEARLWSYVDASLADAALRLSMNRDTLSLAGSVTGADTIRPAVSLALANLGGSVSLSSLKGSLSFAKVSLVSGADVNRALGTIESTGAAPVSIAAASGIANGQTSNDFRKTFAVNGLGNVTVETDTGVRDYSYSQVQDIYKLKVASNTLASTQNFHYWMQQINYGYVKVQLQNGAYISAIDVTQLTTSGTGNLVVNLADGTTESFPVSGSGSIRIDKTVTGFTLYSQTGSYGLGNIDTRAVTPATGWEDMTEVRKLTGAASMLDLTGAGKLVTQVTGKVDSQDPNDVITAHVYRGEQKVETKVIGPDGLLSIQHDGGFSSIVLTHSIEASPLFVGGLSIETDGTAVRTDWAPLSNASNAQLSQLSAPRWVTDVSFNYIDTGRNNGVLYRYGGQDVQINSVLTEGTRNPDLSKYHRLEARLMGSGSVTIRRLLYINAGGLFEVPSEYYTRLGSTVIVHPGAPEFLAVEMQGTGRIEAPYFAQSGEAAEDVLPPTTPNFDADWLQWQAQPHETEGWTEMPSGVINRRIVAVAGSTLGTLWRIRNDGSQAGEVTVKVHVGQTGTTADPVQKIFTGVINPQQSRGLAFNVGILHERDTVFLEIIRPDGTTLEYRRTTSEARSNEIRRVNPVTGKLEWVGSYPLPGREDQLFLAREYEKIGKRMGNQDMIIAAQNLRNAATTEEQRLAYTTLTNLPISSVIEGTERIRLLTEGILFQAGSPVLDPDHFEEDLGGYPELDTDYDYHSDLNLATQWELSSITPMYGVTVDSHVSRIFRGLLSLSSSQTFRIDDTDFKQKLFSIRKVTGIYGSTIKKALSLPAEQREAALRTIFISKGYGHIFSENGAGTMINPVNNPNTIVGIRTDKQIYKIHDGYIRVNLDFSPDKPYHHANLYIMKNGTSLADDSAITRQLTGQLFIDVPVWVLQKRLPVANADDVTALAWIYVQLRVQAQDSNGNRVSDRVTSNFQVDMPKRFTGLSTHPNEGIRAIENQVLETVLKNFPVKDPATPSEEWNTVGWRWDLGSGFHGEHSYHALDINFNSGESDRGMPVYAIDGGSIVSINEKYGSVTIEHKLSDQTKWRTEYMHMLIYPDGSGGFTIRDKNHNPLKTIKVNDIIQPGEIIGTIGGTGQTFDDINNNRKRDSNEPWYTSDSAFGSHLHLVNYIYVDHAWESIDSYKVIELLGINIMAYDAGKDLKPYTLLDNKGYSVKFDEILGALVPKDTTIKLVYDRSALLNEASDSTPSYWKAWEKGKDIKDMTRIIFDSSRNAWVRLGEEHPTEKWDPIAQSFLPL